MDFCALPSGAGYTLKNVSVPGPLLGKSEDLVLTDVTIFDGVISDTSVENVVDARGGILLPAFVDMHTHLDKGHIWGRAPNPDGTFMGALETVASDRAANWSAEDVRARMQFSLRCAYAHGTRALRTHLDSIPPQDGISFPVFSELQADWRGQIDLQAVCLVGMDRVEAVPTSDFIRTADLVAATDGGVLGCVTFPTDDLADRLRSFFAMAEDRGLAVDFHVDETGDPSVATLRTIAEMVLETGFSAPVTVGHCCSVAVQEEAEALHTLDLVAQAGLNVVSLPMCNLYLQDRSPGRTPRWRGITLVHEMVARGITVSFASDNTRDPFYAYGDMDMIEVMREATRIGHLDHSGPDWIRSFSVNPAVACGFAPPTFAPGAPADLVLTKARSWTEFFARPQSDRVVIRRGRAIDRILPDYAELDELMEKP